MTHALVIARREIEERAFVFATAVALALVPLMMLFAPHATGADRKSAVVMFGFLIGVCFTWALALVLGTTLVGRELSEKRLSFYFSRPVSGASIWFGKLIAASALLIGSFAIVHAIPLGLGGRLWETMSTQSRGLVAAGIVGIAFALMLIAHVVSTWIRSRSPLLAVDFIALLVVGALLAASVLPLLFVGAEELAKSLLAVAAFVLVLAIIGAGAWQLARGRVDLRRSHRELSRFLWSVMLAVALVIGGYALWVLSASPRVLHGSDVWATQQGNIINIEGPARGTRMSFVVDLASGASVRQHPTWTDATGDIATSLQPARTFDNAFALLGFPRRTSFVLTVTRLAPRVAPIVELALQKPPRTFAASADGTRVAYTSDDVLAVYDVATRKSTAAKLPVVEPQTNNVQLQFLPGGAVRVYQPKRSDGAWSLHVFDFDATSRTWRRAMAPIPIESSFGYAVAGNDIVTRHRASTWRMRDGRTATTASHAIEIRRGDTVERTIVIPHALRSFIVAEIGNGKLLVSARTRVDRETCVIDTNSGAVGVPMKNVVPTFGSPFAGASASQPRLRALVHRDTGRVDVLDTTTGAIRPLL